MMIVNDHYYAHLPFRPACYPPHFTAYDVYTVALGPLSLFAVDLFPESANTP